jgi:hypothetical protein
MSLTSFFVHPQLLCSHRQLSSAGPVEETSDLEASLMVLMRDTIVGGRAMWINLPSVNMEGAWAHGGVCGSGKQRVVLTLSPIS